MTRIKKIICIVLLVSFVLGQTYFGVAIFQPKRAEAFLGFGDVGFQFTTEIWNPYDIAKELAKAIMVRIAVNYSNQYLTRFVDRVVDKYKIKNFLYYDRVLSDYYLNRFISDKVQDPQLRRIFSLMEGIYLTGDAPGLTTAQRAEAFIPQFKRAIRQEYESKGGVQRDRIYNARSFRTDSEYFDAGIAYFSNPESNTQQRFYNQFGSFQSASTTSAQIEVLVGNGLKAGRIIGGTCSLQIPDSTPESCRAAGGVWQESALDTARSFIDNPTSFVEKNVSAAMDTLLKTTFDPNNPFAAIGSLLGDFIFKKMKLDSASGILSEGGQGYQPVADLDQQLVEQDIDQDGFPDGYDIDGDGLLDVCYHGVNNTTTTGTPGPVQCKESSKGGPSPYFAPLCQTTDRAIFELEEYLRFIIKYQDHFEDNGVDFKDDANSGVWTMRTQLPKNAVDNLLNTIRNYRAEQLDDMELTVNAYSFGLSKIFQSLVANADLDLNTGFGVDDDSGVKGRIGGLIQSTERILIYLLEVRDEGLHGRCDNPDLDAIDAVPEPNIPIEGGGGEGTFLDCDDPPGVISPDPMDVMIQVRDEFPELDLTDESAGGGRDQFTAIVAYRLWQEDPKWGRKKSSSSAPVSTDTLGYLRPDIGPGRFEAVDLLQGGTGELQRGCYGLTESNQVWIQPEPAP